MAKKKPSKTDPKKAPPGTLARAKKAVVGAAERVADAVSDAADAAKKHVITPVGQAVGIVAKPKARPVRAKKAAPKPAAPLPQRSTSAGGKMMSKNLAPLPKEEASTPPQPRSKRKT